MFTVKFPTNGYIGCAKAVCFKVQDLPGPSREKSVGVGTVSQSDEFSPAPVGIYPASVLDSCASRACDWLT